jgi:hypothetical protein
MTHHEKEGPQEIEKALCCLTHHTLLMGSWDGWAGMVAQAAQNGAGWGKVGFSLFEKTKSHLNQTRLAHTTAP